MALPGRDFVSLAEFAAATFTKLHNCFLPRFNGLGFSLSLFACLFVKNCKPEQTTYTPAQFALPTFSRGRAINYIANWHAPCLALLQEREERKDATMQTQRRITSWLWMILVISALLLPVAMYAGNEVMGEVRFEGKTKVEKTSGVWVDGQYVGYLKELRGAKKVLLLPGEHTISVRQNGYQDFTQQVTLQPGEKRIVQVAMQKAAARAMPAVWSIVKISVNPSRAAVFLDGRFVGHVGEFDGPGQSLQVVPGRHAIKIALPGYKTFESDINPSANQKVEVKTNLLKNDVPVDDPALKSNTGAGTEVAPPPSSAPQR
jgi:hypothetical protein